MKRRSLIGFSLYFFFIFLPAISLAEPTTKWIARTYSQISTSPGLPFPYQEVLSPGKDWVSAILPNVNFGCGGCEKFFATIVNGQPASFSFKYASDNTAQLYINGNRVFDHNGTFGKPDYCTGKPCCADCCDGPDHCVQIVSRQNWISVPRNTFGSGNNVIIWRVRQDGGGSGFHCLLNVAGAEVVHPSSSEKPTKEAPKIEKKEPTSPLSSCGSVVGRWRGFYGGDAVFTADGRTRIANATKGTWTCNGRTITIHWVNPDGKSYWDVLKLSDDGRKLEGYGSDQPNPKSGWSVTVERIGDQPKSTEPVQLTPKPITEPNPPPNLLPNNQVTREIINYRSKADEWVGQRYPEMRSRLVLEVIQKFFNMHFYIRVYQQKTILVFSGRKFRATKRLIISFDPQGRMFEYIGPRLEPLEPIKEVVIPRPPAKPIPPLKISPATKQAMVLTNLEKIRNNHPENFPRIIEFLKQYGPVIDLSQEKINPSDWRAVDQIVEKRFDPKKYDCLFIFGGPEVVPHGVYPNPVRQADDHDDIILSDDCYADLNHDPAQDWEIMVVRLPDDRGILENPNSILHRPVPQGEALEHRNFVVYGNSEWPVSRDMAQIGSPQNPKLQLSKPFTHTTFNPNFFQHNNLILSLHGSEQEGRFFWGEEPNTPDAVVPVEALHIDQAIAPGAVIFSVPCYGASITGKSSENSMALRFLRNGARCFIGSTKSSYISPGTDRVVGLWVKLIKSYLDRGENPQRAFLLAKKEFAKSGILEPHQYKVFREFIYLGLPPERYKTKAIEKPTVDIPSDRLFEVRWIRLFEGPVITPELSQEKMKEAVLIEEKKLPFHSTKEFPANSTRRVYAQTYVRNLGKTEHRHEIVTGFYREDGSLACPSVKSRVTMHPNEKHGSYLSGCGSERPGTLRPGSYNVVIQIDGVPVAQETFFITGDKKLGPTSSPGQEKTTSTDPPGPIVIDPLGLMVNTMNEDIRRDWGLPKVQGVVIMIVFGNTPADAEGLKTGDIITHVDKNRVLNKEMLIELLGAGTAGRRIQLTVVRKAGDTRSVAVTLLKK